eukprot:1292738-Pyramimonas_sp.AAC.1
MRQSGPRSASRSRSLFGCGVDVEVRLNGLRSVIRSRPSFGCGVDAEVRQIRPRSSAHHPLSEAA